MAQSYAQNISDAVTQEIGAVYGEKVQKNPNKRVVKNAKWARLQKLAKYELIASNGKA